MKSERSMRTLTWTCGLAASLAVTSAATAAVTPLDFDGPDTVDQYPGTTGGGWATAWVLSSGDASAATVENPKSSATATVTATSPLSSGGNYLDFDLMGRNTNELHRAALKRKFETTTAAGGIDGTQEHTISWKFRLDDANLTNFTTANDAILFADRATGDWGTGANQTWAVKVHGDAQGNAPAKNWVAYDGSTAKDLGMALALNTVYTFVVTVHPGATTANETYDVSINNGTVTTSLTGLTFRDTTATTSWGNLQFTADSDGAGETRSFSIDSISINNVPEPSAIAAMLGAGVLLLRRRKQ